LAIIPTLYRQPRAEALPTGEQRGIVARRIGASILFLLSGCAIASAPIKDSPRIVASPQAGELAVSSQPIAPIGDVQPVFVSIANGTDTPRSVVPSQIFALDGSGSRVAPLPAGEAARQAGGSGELKAALKSGAAGGLLGAGVGAGLGAIAGSLVHSGATGAGLGAAIGGGEGALHGVLAGPDKADRQATMQLDSLALQPGEVRRNFTVSGYVFFPKGEYQQIQLVLVDGESGDTEIVNRPWR
jgi:hypothetical protein